MTTIFTLDTAGNISTKAVYSMDAKRALIAYIRQALFDDYNTWDYPDDLDGIKESTRPGKYYYDLGPLMIGATEGSK